MTAILAAITTTVVLMLGTIAPNGVPNAPRYTVQPSLEVCLAAQQTAMQQAPLVGLSNVYSACVFASSNGTAPLPPAEDLFKKGNSNEQK